MAGQLCADAVNIDLTKHAKTDLQIRVAESADLNRSIKENEELF
jgi:hypothetical protein